MVVQDRETGAESLKHLPWGSHVCVFYNTPDDLAVIFTPYFKAGLENNEFCIWVAPDTHGEKTDKAAIGRVTSAFTTYLKTGQMEVISQDDVYFENNVFNGYKAFTVMSVKYINAFNKGYKGIRIGGCAPWRQNEGWLDLTKYEAEINNKIDKVNAVALCAYPIDKCKPREIIEVLNTHKYVLNTSDSRYIFLGDRKYESALKAEERSEEHYKLIIQNLRKELQEYEERFRKTARASPDIISITTLDEGKFIYVNDNFLRFWGYTRDEVIGHTSVELNLLTDIKKRERMIKRLKIQGRIQNEEAVHRTKSGEIRKVKYSNELHTIDGQPCIITAITDITALKKEEEKERAIINTAIDGFCIIDINGKNLEVSDSYCKMIGYTREELLRMSVSDVEAIESPQKVIEHLRKIMLRGSDHFKSKQRRKDGRIIDVEINASYYNIGEGQLFAFTRDITGSKESGRGRETDTKISWRKNITKLQEKFIKEGFENFKDNEIIELLLSMVMPSRKAKQLAEVCINKFKNLGTFLNAPAEELIKIGVSPTSVFCIAMLHKLPIKVLQEKISRQSIFDSPQDIFDYFYYAMRDLEKEVLKVIFLNARNQIIEIVDLFEGTTDKITINPREVVENAIAHKTSSLVFIHNHPSGDPTPSQADKQLTRDLVFVGNILQIRVLDHIIIGDNRYFSFAREGLIKEYETDFLNLKLTGTSEAKRRLSKARLPFFPG